MKKRFFKISWDESSGADRYVVSYRDSKGHFLHCESIETMVIFEDIDADADLRVWAHFPEQMHAVLAPILIGVSDIVCEEIGT
jgi:hypothetical protein